MDAWAILTSIAFRNNDRDALKESSLAYLDLYEKYQENPIHFNTHPLHTLNQHPMVLTRLSMLARRNGDVSEFADYYAQAKRAAKDVNEIILSVANYLSAIGDIDEAMNILEDELSTGAKPELVEKLVKLMIDQQKYAQAEAVCQTARQSGIDERTVRFLEGVVFLTSNRYDAAQKAFEDILEKNAEDVEAIINLGLVFERLEKLGDAEKCYHESINLEPTRLEAAINLANLYVKRGQHKEAATFYEKITEIDPNLYDIQLALVSQYWELDDIDKLLNRAVYLAKRLGITLPDKLDSARDLGVIFYGVGERLFIMRQLNASTTSFEMAKNLLPEQEEAHLRYGDGLLMLGTIDKAIQAYEEAARTAPEDWRPFEGLQKCYSVIGATEAVKPCEQKALELKKKVH